MLVCDYIVESIDGDYAHLRRTDLPEEELKLVARALLQKIRNPFILPKAILTIREMQINKLL